MDCRGIDNDREEKDLINDVLLSQYLFYFIAKLIALSISENKETCHFHANMRTFFQVNQRLGNELASQSDFPGSIAAWPDQPELDSETNELSTRAKPKLNTDATAVGFYGLDTQVQVVSNLLVRMPFGEA